MALDWTCHAVSNPQTYWPGDGIHHWESVRSIVSLTQNNFGPNKSTVLQLVLQMHFGSIARKLLLNDGMSLFCMELQCHKDLRGLRLSTSAQNFRHIGPLPLSANSLNLPY